MSYEEILKYQFPSLFLITSIFYQSFNLFDQSVDSPLFFAQYWKAEFFDIDYICRTKHQTILISVCRLQVQKNKKKKTNNPIL